MDDRNPQPAPALSQLNRAFKEKWIEIVNKKSSLYEIESKVAVLHQSMLSNLIQETIQENSGGTTESLLIKRPPQVVQTEDQIEEIKNNQKNARFSKDATKILKVWFSENNANPYPR